MLRRKFLILCVFFSSFTCKWAYSDVLSITLEPLVGYEKVQQVLPTRHEKTRLFYGARMITGVLLISAEAEGTRGTSQEVFSDMSQTTTGDRIKLGLRSGFRLGPLLTLSVRGGVQASREKYEQTTNGITATTYDPIVYRPYGGLSARGRLTSHLSATADVVAIIPNVNDLKQNEYQATAGFAVRFP